VLSAGSTKLEGGQTFPLAPVTIIGRASGSQVRLNDAMVSAEHARLRRRNGRWFVQDLGSTNGTLLNQQPVQGERPIEYGDMITIGDVRLKLAR
jgi:pSer/pThr/pTyr-binding forkhead associated (FHA) protein